MGGVHQLVEQLPVINFLDHGITVDQGERQRTAFERYVRLRNRYTHRVVKPGDQVAINGLDVRIIASNGEVLTSPLPQAGQMNPACEGFKFHMIAPRVTC